MAEPSIQEPVEHPEKTNTKNKTIHYLLLMFVSIMSAWAAGRMIGISQYDNAVVAAVVPVLLSAGWGIIFLKYAAINNDKINSNLSAITIALIIFLYVITISADSSYQDEKTKKLDSEYDSKYFENCSYVEFHTNQARSALGLTPLGSNYFCLK